MKYEALFKAVNESGLVIFRSKDYPQSIVMPATGLAILSSVGPLVTPAGFDNQLEWLLSFVSADNEFLYVAESGLYSFGTALVFNDRSYAMGYAHGSGKDVWDISRKKIIRRK